MAPGSSRGHHGSNSSFHSERSFDSLTHDPFASGGVSSARGSSARRMPSSASTASASVPTSRTGSLSTGYNGRRSLTGANKRGVIISDRRLSEMANETEAGIRWSEILRQADDNDRAQWKWLDNAAQFSLYSKQEVQKYQVLAVGVLPCSVAEVTRQLHSPDAEKFSLTMEALYGEEFRDGLFAHKVNLQHLDQDPDATFSQRRSPDLVDLTVKSATFSRSGWLHHHENWSFMDAAYRREGGASFEKIATTLHPKDVVAGKTKRKSVSLSSSKVPSFLRSFSEGSDGNSRTKSFQSVTTAFNVQPEESHDDGNQVSRPWKETRVIFYAEFAPPGRSNFSIPSLSRRSSLSSSSDKAVKLRLLSMARSCGRLTELVRRRRLGVQVLVDRKKLSAFFTAHSQHCVCCNKSIALLSAKMCRLCGQGVCAECSHKHERETKIRGSQRMMLEDIRVCDRCIDRIDRSDFTDLTDKSLMGPGIAPNAPNEPEASTVLKDLLKDELLNAVTATRKATVMNVIKCVLDQEDPIPSPASSTTSIGSSRRGVGGILLTSSRSGIHEADYIDALDKLDVKQVPYTEAELSTTEGRGFAVDPRNPDKQMAYPIPENEEKRLRAMEDVRIADMINRSDELNIICSLAAKEMDTFASMVTIVGSERHQVVAANVDDLQNAGFAREDAFCAHTIMDDRPLIIPHPEADVRFHQAFPVKEMGIKYYCGFPITAADNTVIGALCCIDQSTREMTETQFSAMKKLAETASKVIQVQGKEAARQRTLSVASTKSK